MRQIKASEIRPGMEVEWTSVGVTRKCVAETVDSASPRYGVNLHTSEGGLVHIPGNAEVTVLAEPQPEEPTAFGARVRVRDGRFVRLDDYAAGVVPWSEKGTGAWWSWDDLCDMGPVTVVPDQGWTVPGDTPEVPERIEEWPEDDKHLRAYGWWDCDDAVWSYSLSDGQWGYKYTYENSVWHKDTGLNHPFDGPWTRVADA